MPKLELSESESEDKALSSEEETDNGTANEKDTPLDQEKVSEYEKQRLQRIEANNRRMEALGLRKMAINLMGSAPKTQKKSNDKKANNKIVDEDEEYNPTQEDEEISCSEDDDDDNEFSPSNKTKMKKNSTTPKKRGPNNLDTDFVDDDDALMQAIALSLQDTETSGAHVLNSVPSENDKRKENPSIQDRSRKKGRKPITSRVNMNEDEMLIHFFQFDESGRGSFFLRDVQRLAATHDFTWSEREIADMIYCFDSDGDGKISFDDFRKIVVRCNMLKASEKDVTG
ncbi:RNA polymerase II subunit 5-mediating protein homolog isoform X2 [Salvia hispanica]|uniref:RNA polymerase II subunit 5-mediating protein homolog isoform X2 n=1 Tax=Salvia hispanica TaxID=49212 RepID=UPI002008F465|nr:RNA polymerase II subunit 5-mediating protein homolog isoform X2 [Salvia hispanica]